MLRSIAILLLTTAAQDDVAQLVERLRSEKVEEREEASEKLRALGEKAVPLLRKAAASGDAELVLRAEALLRPYGPAGTLRRIEERLARARSLRVRIRVTQAVDAGEEEIMVGLLSLKEPNKARMVLGPGYSWRESALQCNGKVVWDSLTKRSMEASPKVKECASAGFARAGVDPLLFMSFRFADTDGVSALVDQWSDLLVVDDVRFGPEEKGLKTLRYRLSPSPNGNLAPAAEMTVWYDPATMLPRRRQKKGSVTAVETYEDWAVDGEIPDELFKLPSDRLDEQTRILDKDPSNAVAWAERAAARSELGQWDQAMKDYSRAIELDPRSFRGYAGRGGLRMMVDRDAEALQDFDRAVELDPKEPRVRVDRGWARVKTGRFREAIEDLTTSIELEPRFIGSWIDRGVAWMLLDEPAKALPEFDQAARIDPKWPTVFSNRALALAMLGRSDEALQQAEKALALNRHMPYYAYAARGLARLRKGDRAPALDEFRAFEEHAFKVDPLWPKLRAWKEEAERLK